MFNRRIRISKQSVVKRVFVIKSVKRFAMPEARQMSPGGDKIKTVARFLTDALRPPAFVLGQLSGPFCLLNSV